jgi:hypothetical protein
MTTPVGRPAAPSETSGARAVLGIGHRLLVSDVATILQVAPPRASEYLRSCRGARVDVLWASLHVSRTCTTAESPAMMGRGNTAKYPNRLGGNGDPRTRGTGPPTRTHEFGACGLGELAEQRADPGRPGAFPAVQLDAARGAGAAVEAVSDALHLLGLERRPNDREHGGRIGG